jgi:hypothetical protein
MCVLGVQKGRRYGDCASAGIIVEYILAGSFFVVFNKSANHYESLTSNNFMSLLSI